MASPVPRTCLSPARRYRVTSRYQTLPAQLPGAPIHRRPPSLRLRPQTISVSADGTYLLHYFAQDCAGTEELQFTQTAGSWSTSFYTFPINVDTVAPIVASGPTLSPAPSTNGGVPNSYLIGQTVTANYRCTDERSGIVKCGTSTYAPGTTLNTGNLSSSVDTSKAGPQTFTVPAVDAAGNQTSASVNYTVVAAAGKPGDPESGSPVGEAEQPADLHRYRGQPEQSDGLGGHCDGSASRGRHVC